MSQLSRKLLRQLSRFLCDELKMVQARALGLSRYASGAVFAAAIVIPMVPSMSDAQNPYTDAVEQQYLNRAAANDLPALVGGALATMVEGSESSEADNNSANGGTAAVKSEDLEGDGINRKAVGTGADPTESKRRSQLLSPSSFESQTAKWGPYVGILSATNNQKVNSLFNKDAGFGVLTQTNRAMCLANAAICQGDSNTVGHVNAVLDAGARYRRDYQDMLAKNPRANPYFERCLTETIERSPTASMDDVYAVCMGDSYQEGQGASNRAAVQFGRGWSFTGDQALAAGRGGAAAVAAANLNNLKDGSTTTTTTAAATTNFCSSDPKARAGLMSYAIYNPAIEFVENNQNFRDKNLTKAELINAWNEFVALYGDSKYKLEETAAPGSTNQRAIVKLTEEKINPYVCNGTSITYKDTLGERRKQFAIKAIEALLRKGDPASPTEAGKPGLIVERCDRISKMEGPFISARSRPNLNNNNVSEFCNPDDNSQNERRAAISFGDYMFGSQHCEAAWHIAQRWLEGVKGTENKGDGLVEFKCSKLTELGDELIKEFTTGKSSRTIRVDGEYFRKPDFAIFALLWARAKAFFATDVDLYNKVLQHTTSILVSSDPLQKALSALVEDHVSNIHRGSSEKKDQVLLAFAAYSEKVRESVKDDQSFRGGMITYGAGGSPNVRKGDNS